MRIFVSLVKPVALAIIACVILTLTYVIKHVLNHLIGFESVTGTTYRIIIAFASFVIACIAISLGSIIVIFAIGLILTCLNKFMKDPESVPSPGVIRKNFQENKKSPSIKSSMTHEYCEAVIKNAIKMELDNMHEYEKARI